MVTWHVGHSTVFVLVSCGHMHVGHSTVCSSRLRLVLTALFYGLRTLFCCNCSVSCANGTLCYDLCALFMFVCLSVLGCFH